MLDRIPSQPTSSTMQRVQGRGEIAFKNTGDQTKLDRLYQTGAAKIRLPKTHNPAIEAILINTAGGLTGGDVLTWRIEAANNTQSVFTTQACEKAYQSNSGAAHLTTEITLGSNAALAWLPQETILYNGAHLDRSLTVNLASGAIFLACEAVVLGREAMGETLDQAIFQDHWRIKRAGALAHAEETRIDATNLKALSAAALLQGHRAFATVLLVRDSDKEALETIKVDTAPLIEGAGAMSAMESKLVARLWAPSAYALRHKLVPFLHTLNKKTTGAALPRVWGL